ncbi:speckle-type POZ protein B isoform X2 [Aethina tumida]|uniref:speckle-type POZ protein B isoform X2 n=1 Tax=Aethina tumida TaxID=116153 RepID=UPI00096AF92D|nr:speckle-type POZ protein B isoform X2 [Aethina tumida]
MHKRVYSSKKIKMPQKPKPKAKKEPPVDVEVGAIHEELEIPVASEVIFKKIWTIKQFNKTIAKRDLLDSPIFRCSVNGMSTFWNVAVRFWKGPQGKKVTNPLVVCLNLTGCETEETGQARVRFQFGVWDASIRHWETCDISSVVLNLQNTQELLSVGYKSLGILDRHIDNNKNVAIMVKLQIIQSDEEVHSLSQDMARLLDNRSDNTKDTLIECTCGEKDEPILVHSWIIKTRSVKLARKLQDHQDPKNKNVKYKIDFADYQHALIQELIRYIYTDKVENAETFACRLLPLGVKYELHGLKALCDRTLCSSLTPSNVANILLLADQCGCENLRKAALHYCEESEEIKGSVQIGKNLAWRVMEMVNPDLFLEACESIGSSSSNLDSPGTPGSWSD